MSADVYRVSKIDTWMKNGREKKVVRPVAVHNLYTNFFRLTIGKKTKKRGVCKYFEKQTTKKNIKPVCSWESSSKLDS